MPLCPQITNTPITVTQTADFTVTSVTPITAATTADTGSLQTQITTAQATADGKNKVTYSTSSPFGSGTNVGDIWWQYSAGIVIGQWSWNGSSWASAPIGNAVIANIDAGKITAGIISGIEYNNGSGTFRVTPAGALTATNATITGAITATSGSFTGAITSTSGTIGGFTISSTNLNSGNLNLYSTGDVSTNATIYSNYLSIASATLGSYRFAVQGNSGFYGTVTSTGDMTAQGELVAFQAQTNSTTAATNCYITTGGLIRRTSNTSSMRFKENIVDLLSVPELDPKKLLDLPVVAFTYKQGHIPDSDDRANQMLPGFIAEDVDAIYPIAADYEGGDVATWNSFYMVPALLSLVQDLYKRVEELEAK